MSSTATGIRTWEDRATGTWYFEDATGAIFARDGSYPDSTTATPLGQSYDPPSSTS